MLLWSFVCLHRHPPGKLGWKREGGPIQQGFCFVSEQPHVGSDPCLAPKVLLDGSWHLWKLAQTALPTAGLCSGPVLSPHSQDQEFVLTTVVQGKGFQLWKQTWASFGNVPLNSGCCCSFTWEGLEPQEGDKAWLRAGKG